MPNQSSKGQDRGLTRAQKGHDWGGFIEATGRIANWTDHCPLCGALRPVEDHDEGCRFDPDDDWKRGHIYFSDTPPPESWDAP